jgi:hypothetical protein
MHLVDGHRHPLLEQLRIRSPALTDMRLASSPTEMLSGISTSRTTGAVGRWKPCLSWSWGLAAFFLRRAARPRPPPRLGLLVLGLGHLQIPGAQGILARGLLDRASPSPRSRPPFWERRPAAWRPWRPSPRRSSASPPAPRPPARPARRSGPPAAVGRLRGLAACLAPRPGGGPPPPSGGAPLPRAGALLLLPLGEAAGLLLGPAGLQLAAPADLIGCAGGGLPQTPRPGGGVGRRDRRDCRCRSGLDPFLYGCAWRPLLVPPHIGALAPDLHADRLGAHRRRRAGLPAGPRARPPAGAARSRTCASG